MFLIVCFVDDEWTQGRDPDAEPEATDPGVEILHPEFGEAGFRGTARDAAEVMIRDTEYVLTSSAFSLMKSHVWFL